MTADFSEWFDRAKKPPLSPLLVHNMTAARMRFIYFQFKLGCLDLPLILR